MVNRNRATTEKSGNTYADKVYGGTNARRMTGNENLDHHMESVKSDDQSDDVAQTTLIYDSGGANRFTNGHGRSHTKPTPTAQSSFAGQSSLNKVTNTPFVHFTQTGTASSAAKIVTTVRDAKAKSADSGVTLSNGFSSNDDSIGGISTAASGNIGQSRTAGTTLSSATLSSGSTPKATGSLSGATSNVNGASTLQTTTSPSKNNQSLAPGAVFNANLGGTSKPSTNAASATASAALNTNLGPSALSTNAPSASASAVLNATLGPSASSLSSALAASDSSNSTTAVNEGETAGDEGEEVTTTLATTTEEPLVIPPEDPDPILTYDDDNGTVNKKFVLNGWVIHDIH
jgi:hypothetical protein